mgnify:CR=1 FL=1
MENLEEKKEELKKTFNLNAFIQEQEELCTKELQEVLEKYNCIVIPEVLISTEGIKPNLKIKYIK